MRDYALDWVRSGANQDSMFLGLLGASVRRTFARLRTLRTLAAPNVAVIRVPPTGRW